MTDIQTFVTTLQRISLERIDSEGFILDIGGGGEGLVSRIEGKMVCAVDIRLNEVYEAQIHNPPSHWFVADGRFLCFKDGVFDAVTLWFSLGYMREWDIKLRVLSEARRVLKDDGKLSILASEITCKEERFVLKASFVLPDGTISQVSYGVRGNQDQTVEKVRLAVIRTGFVIDQYDSHTHWFRLTATKR